MKIFARVKPNSKVERVEKISGSEFILYVKAAAREGRANEAVRELLSEYFKIPRSQINIIKGHKSKNKIISIVLS